MNNEIKAKISYTKKHKKSIHLPPYVEVEIEFMKWWRANTVIDNPSSVSLRKFYDIIEKKFK